jgi:acid stress-induced BolA-like protein IbaG/YrbA
MYYDYGLFSGIFCIMTPQHIEQLISQHISDAKVSVNEVEGKFTATVISEQFDGLMPIKRHKLVYASVNDEITSGALHALTIIAKTPAEAQ